MALFDSINVALLVLPVLNLQRAAGAPYHPAILIGLEAAIDEEFARLFRICGGLRREARVLAERLTRMGICTNGEDLIQGLMVKFLERRRAGALPLFVSYRYLEMQLLQEYSAIRRRHVPLKALGCGQSYLNSSELASSGLVGGTQTDASLDGFFTSNSDVDLEICLIAVDSLLRGAKPAWIAEAAKQLKITEEKVRGVLSDFASQLARQLELSETHSSFLESLLLWEDRTYGWKGRLAKSLSISSPTVAQRLKAVRRAFARQAGLDPHSRRIGRSRRRPAPPQPVADENAAGPVAPRPAAGGGLFPPAERLHLLRFFLGGNSAALDLLDRVRGLASDLDLHALLNDEALPVVARRISTCWAQLIAWNAQAERQYNGFRTDPPAWLDEELADWPKKGARRWIPALRDLAQANLPYPNAAAKLGTTPLQVVVAMVLFSESHEARLFYARLQQVPKHVVPDLSKLRRSSVGQLVTPTWLQQQLDMVEVVLAAAQRNCSYSDLSTCFTDRLAMVRTLITLRDFRATGSTCLCERRFQLCLS